MLAVIEHTKATIWKQITTGLFLLSFR